MKNISLLSFEKEIEPSNFERDEEIKKFCDKQSVKVSSHSSHTLYDLDYMLEQCNYEPPITMTSF